MGRVKKQQTETPSAKDPEMLVVTGRQLKKFRESGRLHLAERILGSLQEGQIVELVLQGKMIDYELARIESIERLGAAAANIVVKSI